MHCSGLCCLFCQGEQKLATCRSTREGLNETSAIAARHDSDAPASWGSLHENAVYLEERRTTRSTRDWRASLADELPDDFQVVDTASGVFGQPQDSSTIAKDHAGIVLRNRGTHAARC